MDKARRRQWRPFDAQAFLDSAGAKRTVVRYARGTKVFSQGDAASSVLYLQTGSVKLSVLSKAGRNAVIEIRKSLLSVVLHD